MDRAPASLPSTLLAPILRTDELRAIEAEQGAAPLMERAGRAAAEVARGMLADRPGTVLVLAGPGNNGGDAFVVARHLRQWFFDVTVLFAASPEHLPAAARTAHAAFTAAGGTTVSTWPAHAPGGLIVDGLFGIGLTRAPGPPYSDWIAWTHRDATPILALDIPSGLPADTALAPGAAIMASATSTFIALKPGLLTGDGPDHCGRLHVHALGLADAVAAKARGHRLEWAALAAALPDVLRRRRRNVHKGTFGTVGIIGGATGMLGAPLLAGRAALRAGAGRVRIGFAARSHPIVDIETPELMAGRAGAILDSSPDVLVVGPGLGTDGVGVGWLQRAAAATAPLVLDADALNLVAQQPALREAVRQRAQAGRATILTPHPAEAARLLGSATPAIQADRLDACLTLARAFDAHVVLKGAGSIVAAPDGAYAINASGNSGLATAGSGDVLSGFVGALLAQQLDARTALCYAVCLHGAAADALVAAGRGPVGLAPSELADTARVLLNAAARDPSPPM